MLKCPPAPSVRRRVPLRARPVFMRGEKVPNDESDGLEISSTVVVDSKVGLSSVVPPNQAWLYLALLFAMFTCNQTARQVFYYICDFSNAADPFRYMNVDLGFSREEYAALASFGFTVTFATTSLVAGGFADKNRRNLLAAISCMLWSSFTLLQGQTSSFAQVLPLRASVGFAQAFFNPAAYTLLAEYFPQNMIAQVNGIFTSGIYLGGAFSSLAIFLDERIGWRGTLSVIGGVGLVLAVLAAGVLPEPRDGVGLGAGKEVAGAIREGGVMDVEGGEYTKEDTETGEVLSSMTKVLSGFMDVLATAGQSREAMLLLSSTALRYCAGFTIGIWKAPFIFSKFPGGQEIFAGSNAAIIAVAGVFSCVVGGVIADRLAEPQPVVPSSPSEQASSTTVVASSSRSRGGGRGVPRRRPRARAWVPAIGSLLAAPTWVLFCHSATTQETFFWLFVEYIFAECWFGPTLASFYELVEKDQRGSSNGLFALLTAVGNVAPVVVGALTGGRLGVSMELGDALSWAVGGSYFLSGLGFLYAALLADRRIEARLARSD